MKTMVSAVLLSAGILMHSQTHVLAQSSQGLHDARIEMAMSAAAAAGGEQQGDTAYALYRQGYRQVLEERWDQARKVFTDLVARYPKSTYVDDARYWSAYALMQTDREKALEAYRSFVENHRSSSYYTDALADMNQLQINMALVARKAPFVAITRTDAGGTSYTIAITPHVKGLERQVKGVEREVKGLEREVRIKSGLPGQFSTGVAGPPSAPGMIQEQRIDPDLQLRIQVVSAIGRSREDQKSFDALKDIVLDHQQPSLLRIVAINSIAEFKKHDALPVLVQVAQTDTNVELQNTAIDFIAYAARDKNRSVEALEEIFESLPADRTDQLATALFAIADVGNDRAVALLTRVATTSPNYDLRSDAVFYLGSIGSEKARAALVDIFRRK
jgi:tetratricopeptide (TPR) repeat protein